MAATYNTSDLQAAIEAAFVKAAEETTDPIGSRVQVSTDISAAIEVFVRGVIDSARVNFKPGTVTGNTPVQGAPTPLTMGAAKEGEIS